MAVVAVYIENLLLLLYPDSNAALIVFVHCLLPPVACPITVPLTHFLLPTDYGTYRSNNAFLD